MGCWVENERQKSNRTKGGGEAGEEIVGTPVMIRLITKATTAVARVCCLYPGRCGGGEGGGGFTGRELAMSLNKTRH